MDINDNIWNKFIMYLEKYKIEKTKDEIISKALEKWLKEKTSREIKVINPFN